MNRVDDAKVKSIMHTIGLNNNLTDEQIKHIVEAQFRFTWEEIRKIEFEGLTAEEIDELKTNFYFKYIGKLYANSITIAKQKRREEFLNKLFNKEEDGRQTEL